MLKKKILAASMLAAMSGGMVAEVQAIEVSDTNIGQLLLQPLYFGLDGLTTDLVVVNTRTDAAVLAKVVFRSAEHSLEALDFFIYLTPGDTWRGTVQQGVSAEYGSIYSEDDSMLRSATEFASADNPVSQDFNQAEANSQGHIEVIGIRSAVNGIYDVQTADGIVQVEVFRGMSKPSLRTLMDAAYGAVSGMSTTCGPDVMTPGRQAIDPCHLMMLGTATVVVGADRDTAERASNEMTALSASNYALGNVAVNEMGDSMIGAGDATLPNYVVSNSVYNQDLAGESSIGPNMGTSGVTSAFPGDTQDHTVPLEWALQANHLAQAWEAGAGAGSAATLTQVTFPTKYLHDKGSDPCGVWTGNPSGSASPAPFGMYSAPFQYTEQGEIPYNLLTCNNSEQCNEAAPDPIFSGVGEEIPVLNFPIEVNLVGLGHLNGAVSGWENLHLLSLNIYNGTSFQNIMYCPYYGVPQISSAIKVNGGVNLLWEKLGVRNH